MTAGQNDDLSPAQQELSYPQENQMSANGKAALFREDLNVSGLRSKSQIKPSVQERQVSPFRQ